jgi:phosphoglycerate dehydrogenase-like enzyme
VLAVPVVEGAVLAVRVLAVRVADGPMAEGPVAAVKVLFPRPFTRDLSWDALKPALPGWEIETVYSGDLTGHLDGADVICPLGSTIDRRLIEAGRFGLVQQYGVGLERIDVAAATEHGVWVARIAGESSGNADGVAEIAVLHLLALARTLDEVRDLLREQRRWAERASGRSLFGATVLVVGLGAIGAAVARRLAPFGAELLAVRAHPELGGPPEVTEVAGPDRLPELLARADAVVCTAMFGPDTANMFDAAAFAAIKPGALFVNVARGGLVDEAALLAALESGQVGGAGLDVFAQEPPDPDSPLLRHPRVVATPHVGGLTDVMFRRTAELFAANLRRWAGGEAPRWAVNSPPSGRSSRACA